VYKTSGLLAIESVTSRSSQRIACQRLYLAACSLCTWAVTEQIKGQYGLPDAAHNLTGGSSCAQVSNIAHCHIPTANKPHISLHDDLNNTLTGRLQKLTKKLMPTQVYTREPHPGMGTGFQMDSCLSLRLCSSWKTRSYPLGGLSRGTLPFWSVLSPDTLSWMTTALSGGL